MASALEEALLSDGWRLKKEVIDQFANDATSVKKDVIGYAVNQDLLEVGEKYIKDKLNSSDGLLVGPCVLQIAKVRNISAPKENEESSFAPRMLKLTLTDGTSSVYAVEIDRIDGLSLQTPPGTKVKLIGSVPSSSGHLHLQSSCIKVLGGRVEKLYTKWQVAKETARFTRNVNIDGGPPAFIAFGKKPRTAQKSHVSQSAKSLKDPKKEGSENTEFSEQRKAAIAEVAKATGSGKKFSTDAKVSVGKKPFQRPDAPINPSVGQFVKEQKIEMPHAKGMYRELSTASGENVHEKTVSEFVEMGFKREDVILCLRKNNNEFEAAMDMLVEIGSQDDVKTFTDNRRGRESRGGRTRGNRGAHRNRRGRDQPEQDENVQSSPATLFDFLESKMPSASVVSNPESSSRDLQFYKQQDYASSSVEQNPGRRNGHDFNTSGHSSGYRGNFSQRGGRGNMGRGTGFAGEYSQNSHGYGRGNRGRGRTDGNMGRGAGFAGEYSQNSQADGRYVGAGRGTRGGRGRTDGNIGRGPVFAEEYSQNSYGDGRVKRGGRGRTDNNNMGRGAGFAGEYSQNSHGDGRGKRGGRGRTDGNIGRGQGFDGEYSQNSHGDGRGKRGGRGRTDNKMGRGAGFAGEYRQNSRGGGRGRTDMGDGAGFAGEYSQNSHDDGRYSDHKGPSYNEAGYQRGKRYNTHAQKSFRNDYGDVSSDNRPVRYNDGRNAFKPQTEDNRRSCNQANGNNFKGRADEMGNFSGNSSYSRSHWQEGRTGGDRNKDFDTWSHSKQSAQSGQVKTNDRVDGGEAFPGFSQNPPPSRGPATTFGQPSKNTQYQSVAPTGPTSGPYSSGQPGPRVSVTLPQWQKGSHCLAKYWEDSSFHEAVVTDIHPTANTAVVQFSYFNNYEEVKLHDLKPLPFGNRINFEGSHGSTSFGPSKDASQPHRPPQHNSQEQVDRLHKPAKALYVPPAQRPGKR